MRDTNFAYDMHACVVIFYMYLYIYVICMHRASSSFDQNFTNSPQFHRQDRHQFHHLFNFNILSYTNHEVWISIEHMQETSNQTKGSALCSMELFFFLNSTSHIHGQFIHTYIGFRVLLKADFRVSHAVRSQFKTPHSIPRGFVMLQKKENSL